MRSDSAPHTWRLKNAEPSSTDSIAAPCTGLMPRSLQNATRCACGIDIGTQQVKIAHICRVKTRLAGQPRTEFCARAALVTVG